jgi:WD40 repeat protein
MVRAAAFSPDGRIILTASDDGTARLWRFFELELQRGGRRDFSFKPLESVSVSPLGEPLRHEGLVYAAVFSPNGQFVATASHNALGGSNRVQFWSADNDRRYSTNSSADGTVRRHIPDLGRPRGEVLEHRSYIHTVAFSPDGETVLTGSADGTAQLWSGSFTGPRGEPLRHGEAVYAAAFSSDGETVVTASQDGAARLWKYRVQQGLGSFNIDNHSDDKAWQGAESTASQARIERVRLWVQVLTLKELDSSGSVRSLDVGTWRKLRQRLQELDGRP